jgi:hypothetical protein
MHLQFRLHRDPCLQDSLRSDREFH